MTSAMLGGGKGEVRLNVTFEKKLIVNRVALMTIIICPEVGWKRERGSAMAENDIFPILSMELPICLNG